MFGRKKQEGAPDGGGEAQREQKKGWFSRLKDGLTKSTDKITGGIDAVIDEAPEEAAAHAEAAAEPVPTAAPEPEKPEAPAPTPAAAETEEPARPGLAERIVRFVRRRKLDDAALEAIEEVLITADLGPAAATKLTANLARDKFDKAVSSEEIREALAENVAAILEPVAQPLTPDPAKHPHVVLVVGVNGSGKTTTIGKLGKQWTDQGLTVSFAAGDTFRAAAVEQLKIWGERVGAEVVARDTGADAAGLAFDALQGSKERGDDVLLIDTAGRLQNKADLMAELEKIVRVIRKLDATAPHSVLLVLDATVGQNAHSQVQIFKEIAEVSGLIVTKLDGSAKGGVIVALAESFGLPIHAIGVGEGADDMRPFEPKDFARGLMGLEG
jgi:fused signal recognition particle receptor